MTISSHPELASLNLQALGSESEIKATALKVLADIHQLRMIEDTLSYRHKAQKGIHSFDEVFMAKDFVYRLKMTTRTQPGQQVAVRALIARSKEGVFKADSVGQAELRRAYLTSGKKSQMDNLLEQEVVLKPDRPIVFATHSERETFYIMLLLRSETQTGPSAKDQLDNRKRGREVDVVPEPTQTVQPHYPRELKNRLIGGRIQLNVSIDEKGKVIGVAVEKSIHPYLSYCAVQALLKWTFQPVLRKGKPIRASFPYAYYFNPHSGGEPTIEPKTGPSDESPTSVGNLGDILAHAQEYCRLLSDAALNFICEETIRELHYNLIDNISSAMLVLKKEPELMVARRVQIMDPKRTIRNEFVCDYQLTRNDRLFQERRIILRENRRFPGSGRVLVEKRFSGISSLLSPLRVLSGDRQGLFKFSLLESQRIHARNAFVVDAAPISGNEDGIWSARIWIDHENYGILRCEIEGVPIEGYDDILTDCASLNSKPSFTISHDFGFEKNGIFFPSRSKIRATYPGVDIRGPIEKLTIDLRYDRYKFFTVETQTQVIK